jgi:hypothetical protein
VADEASARKLERYFKSGSGKPFAKKRFLQQVDQAAINAEFDSRLWGSEFA